MTRVLERVRVELARDSWLTRCAWTVALLEFGLVAIAASHGAGIDLYWVHLATKDFLHGGEPYAQELFVYPPSALLLLAPVGIGDFDAVRTAFLAVDALAVAAGAAVCVALVGRSWTSATAAGLLLLLSLMPAVRLTLALDNLNGLIFLTQAVAFLGMVRGRWTLAAVGLGLGFALKPILVPLLLVPLLLRRWSAVAIALAIPTLLSAIAVLLNRDAFGFVTEAVPFLIEGNHPHLRKSNVSILGTADNLGLPAALGQVARVVVLVACLALAWLRWRAGDARQAPGHGGVDALRLLEATGFVLLATLMCFSFGWTYYGIYLVPLVVTVLCAGSLLRNATAFAGLLLMFSPTALSPDRFTEAAAEFERARPALAWLLILIGMGLAMRRSRRGMAPSTP